MQDQHVILNQDVRLPQCVPVCTVNGFECLLADLTGVHDHLVNSHANGVSIVGLDPTSAGRKMSVNGADEEGLNGCNESSSFVWGK